MATATMRNRSPPFIAHIDLGITFFDTADVYGPHTNEELLGRALQRQARIALLSRPSLEFCATRISRNFAELTANPIMSSKRAKEVCAGSALIASIFTINIGSIRRRRSRKRWARWRSWCARARCAFSVCRKRALKPSGGRMPFILSPRCNRNIRSGRAIRKTRCSAGLSRARNRFCSLFSPLGRGFLTGQIKKPKILPADDYRRTAPRFQGENFPAQSGSGEPRKEIARKNVARLRSSRWPGCWRKAKTSCRFQERSAGNICTKMSVRRRDLTCGRLGAHR